MADGIIPLDDVDITGVDDVPVDTSTKLHGPPGTGKTTQSAARVGRLLRDHGYELSDVAWCTYRKQLALDTLKRFVSWDLIDERQLEQPTEGPTRYISTTHAVANRCVGSLPDPAESWQRKDFCDRMGLQYYANKPWDDTAGKLLFHVFDWMASNCLNPALPEDVRQCPATNDLYEHWRGDVSEAWNRWEGYKAQRDIIDYHEMLEEPIGEVAPTDDILVIDEYHDATPLMAKLSEYWIDQADIVIVAGDPHQVVNSFDGADPRFFERVDLPEVLLDTTYRVPEEHWLAATSILSKAHDAPPVTRNSHGQIREYSSPSFETSGNGGWDAPTDTEGSPDRIVANHGENTLFLTRTQMQADGVATSLERAGIIYYSQTDLNGWNTDNGSDRLAAHNALQKIRGFEPGHFGRSHGLGQWSEVPANPDSRELSPHEAVTLLRLTNAKYLAQSRSDTEDICDDLSEDEQSITLSTFDQFVEDEFWHRHSAGAASVERLNKGPLSDRDRVALKAALKRYRDPIQPDDIGVGCLTIHASKGQEADDVVVYDGISRRVRRGMETSDRAYRNEWRTWYVACTRASKRLHIMRGGFRWTSPIIPQNICQTVQKGLTRQAAAAGGGDD